MIYRHRRDRKIERTYDLISNLDIFAPVLSENELNNISIEDILYGKYIEEDLDKYKKISSYLNKFEYISIGIRDGYFDERLLKAFLATAVLSAYSRYNVLIEKIRINSDSPQVYINLEALARRWRVG